MHKYVMMGIALTGAATIAATAVAAVPAAEFVKKAGASDLYEEQSSKLVLMSKNAKVKSFANMMIADHMKTTAGVKAAVKANGMMPKPPMLEPKQAEMIAALKASSGTARDTLYIDQQKTAHQEALALHSDYSMTGDNPALKKASASAVPIVKHHIAMLAAM